ncbi:MAG: hypothetical protein OIF34_02125 [Porticoccaceae bacterium]|nr:hypothetical protein [Porticoccaceae bacterium]
MTKLTVALLGTCLILAGCGPDEKSNALCDNHGAIHSSHRHQIALLSMDYRENGELHAQLQLPDKDSLQALLQNPESLFALSHASDCTLQHSTVGAQGDHLLGTYRFQCPPEVPLKGVNTRLLEMTNQVDEIEATIKTPATRKHFVIHRDCPKPIFHLDPK